MAEPASFTRVGVGLRQQMFVRCKSEPADVREKGFRADPTVTLRPCSAGSWLGQGGAHVHSQFESQPRKLTHDRSVLEHVDPHGTEQQHDLLHD